MHHDASTTHPTAPNPEEAAMLNELVELAMALQAELQAFADSTGKRQIAVSIPVLEANDAARLPLLYAFLEMVGINARPQHGSASGMHIITLENEARPAVGVCEGQD